MSYNLNLQSLLQAQSLSQSTLPMLGSKNLIPETLKNPFPSQLPLNSAGINLQMLNLLNLAKMQSQLQMGLFQAQLLTSLQRPPSLIPALDQKPTIPSLPQLSPVNLQLTNKAPVNSLILNKEKGFKAQIKDILEFVINNCGRISESELEKAKVQFESDSKLVNVFNALVTKYSASVKTKENIVKYILRKVFKAMKENLMKENNLDSKAACRAFVDKYFPESREELKERNINTDDDEELFNALMPFK